MHAYHKNDNALILFIFPDLLRYKDITLYVLTECNKMILYTYILQHGYHINLFKRPITLLLEKCTSAMAIPHKKTSGCLKFSPGSWLLLIDSDLDLPQQWLPLILWHKPLIML